MSNGKIVCRKNNDNDLEKELAYCKALEERIEKEPSISSILAVSEKLNLLKETIEDTQKFYINKRYRC
jgi:hypothetical protein